MSTYNIALFFHLLGVLLFVAGVVVAGVAFEFARRQQGPAEIQLLLTMARAGVLLVGVGSVLLGGFGLWLVHLGDFGYSTGWIDVSIALYLIALILGALGGQRPRQARRLSGPAEQRSSRNDRPSTRTPRRPTLPRRQLRLADRNPRDPRPHGIQAVTSHASASSGRS